tara:strand:- start:1365 stop:1826 length:462 start_codon:yes stop_codon:yes gene_type:complete
MEKKIEINFLDVSKSGCEEFPKYQTIGASGLDLAASPDLDNNGIEIKPGEWNLIPTGIAIELSDGLEAQIRPRSSIAFKNGVTILNSPGTIDSDYRGEIKILLINHGQETFTVKPGDRIAQMVITRVERVNLEKSEFITKTIRGSGGFGSTGI